MNTSFSKVILALFTIFLVQQGAAQSGTDAFTSMEWNVENDAKLAADPGLIERLSSTSISFKGGLILEAKVKGEFGGLSSLEVYNDGKSLMAISDYNWSTSFDDNYRSQWVKLDLSYDKSVLSSATIQSIGQVHDLDGKLKKGEIESMAAGNNVLYLSFDDSYEIWSYNTAFVTPADAFSSATKSYTLAPTFLPHYDNAGIEALTFTSDQKLFAIYEMGTDASFRHAWLLDPITNTCTYFKYPCKMNEMKAITTLTNGDFIVLEKTWNGDTGTNHVKLVRIKKDDLGKADMTTETLLDVEAEAIDNCEGLTSYSVDGKQYLLMVSDDNGDSHAVQKTLLFHFEVR